MNQRQGRLNQTGQTTNRRNVYIEGNVVRKTDVRRELQQVPYRVQQTSTRNNRKARHMNLPYVMFLSVAMLVLGITLFSYLQAQAKLTVTRTQVATLESQVNDLRLSNDERVERIEASLSMDELKRIAIEELGMTYAKKGQVVIISDEGSDYVRQLAQMP